MPIRASIPGKSHPAGWTPATPYSCPDDPMPRNASALKPDVVSERTPESSVMPVAEDHVTPRAKEQETEVFRGAGAEGHGDGLRTGKVPKQPGAPSPRRLPGVKRHR